jgi:hypothetical protein
MSTTLIPTATRRSTAAAINPPAVEHAKWPIEWIAPLAEPYLRGYKPVVERTASLVGYRFLAQPSVVPGKRQPKSPASSGFFVGYLLSAGDFSFLRPQPPECLVFWFVKPVGGALHRRVVTQPQSLGRHTTEYIRWLTHRPPRFEFYDHERIALVRHDAVQSWPRERYEHLSRNFFIETMAWLVRSGLIRHLPYALAQGGASI